MNTDQTNINPSNFGLIDTIFPAKKETHFQHLIEQLNEIVFTINANGCLTYLNPAWYQRTGYEITISLGQPIQNFVHPDDLAKYSHLFSTTEKKTCEIRVFDKNCNILWFEASIKPLTDKAGCTELMGTLVDMTRRVNAAEELKASKERFSLAATASNDGIWDWNLLTDEVYFSPRWKEMLGYTDAELTNQYATWYDLIHPDDLKETMTNLTACLEGENNLYESVHRLKHKNGGWCWILDRGIVMRDHSGRALRMSGSHADITRLKHIEEQLLARQHELNTIFSMSPDGIVTLTEAGDISSVNPMFEAITGFSSEELMLIPEAEFTDKMRSLSISSPYAIDENKPYTLVQITPKNPSAPSLQCSNIANHNLRILKVTICKLDNESISKIMYFRDVTLETEVDRLKSEFLSTAAHELRTPMSSVFGFTELLLTREFEKSTKREILLNIHRQTASLVRMVNDLLDLAKIEAGMVQEFHFFAYTLQEVVKKTLAEFMIHGDDRRINVFYTDDAPRVSIDLEQIKRALTNILSNACKYSPDGVTVTISIRQRDIGNGAEAGIVIKDQGIGMTAEQLSHIFERFWRGTNTQHITGTGLGMSLVREIMNIHQGLIEISSEPDKGTEVGLWFKTAINGEQ